MDGTAQFANFSIEFFGENEASNMEETVFPGESLIL